MTHDELLDRVYWHWRYVQGQDGLQALTDYRRTILAVVRLHRPEEQDHKQYEKCWNCNLLYPCPTIQAIEAELK